MRTEELTELGDAYADEADFEEAYRMYLEAALAGDADACLRLAWFYLYGNEYIDQDFAKGFHYLVTVYELSGKIRGGLDLVRLSEVHSHEEAWKCAFRDYIEAMLQHEEWSFLILKGNNMREDGLYPPNAAEEIRCYEAAWDHGIELGHELIAEMYYHGRGVDQDYKKAYELLTSYESKDISLAKPYFLGEMYLNGYYVEQDKEKATEYFREITARDGFWERDEYYGMAVERLEEMGEWEE